MLSIGQARTDAVARTTVVQGVNMPPVAAPTISILVRWVKSDSASLAEQFARTLSKAGIRATWAVAGPAQAQALRAKVGVKPGCEIAVFIDDSPVDAAAMSRRLQSFDAADQDVAAIEVASHLPRGSFERQLCQSGVRAIISRDRGGKAAMARPLPFGVWAFTPQIVLPARRGWLSFFSGRKRLLTPQENTPSLAVIDLSRVVAKHVHRMDEYVAEVAALAANGKARIASIGELTAEYSQQTAARPQRSILRAAA